jgi:hypothetical protein
MIRKSTLIMLFTLAAGLSAAYADTINFENLPDTYFFSVDATNIGSYYSGLTFGDDVTALSVSRFGGYDDAGFPPHSGDVVIWSAFDPDITVDFAQDQTSVGAWYTSYDFLTLSAYDGEGNLLGTATGDPNTDGFSGAADFLSLNAPDIASVTFSGDPSLYTLDDLTFTPASRGNSVPEPTTITLLATGLGALLLKRRSCL